LNAGFAKAGGSKSLANYDICPFVPVSMNDDIGQARLPIKQHLALYIGGMGAREKNFYNDLVRMYGYAQEAREIQDLYLSGQKQAAEARVPAALLESLSLIGPEGYIKDRIAAFKAAGVTLLDLQPAGPNPLQDVAKVKEWVS